MPETNVTYQFYIKKLKKYTQEYRKCIKAHTIKFKKKKTRIYSIA